MCCGGYYNGTEAQFVQQSVSQCVVPDNICSAWELSKYCQPIVVVKLKGLTEIIFFNWANLKENDKWNEKQPWGPKLIAFSDKYLRRMTY